VGFSLKEGGRGGKRIKKSGIRNGDARLLLLRCKERRGEK
jgi:hypothetical protein